MRYNPALVAEDGFCINFCDILLRLVRPIIISRKDKMNLIDPKFLISNNLIDFTKMTHFGSQNDREDIKLDIEESKGFNFVTQIFCLTHSALNSGYIPAFTKLKHMYRATQGWFGVCV